MPQTNCAGRSKEIIPASCHRLHHQLHPSPGSQTCLSPQTPQFSQGRIKCDSLARSQSHGHGSTLYYRTICVCCMAYADNQNSNGISYEVCCVDDDETVEHFFRSSCIYLKSSPCVFPSFLCSELFEMTTTISTHARRTKDQRRSWLLLTWF